MIAERQIAFGKAAGKGLSAKDYIQDGLIAMWDGIENAGFGEHDANSTTWKDLSGNGFDMKIKSVGENYVDLSNRPKLTYPELLSVLGEEHFTIQMLFVFGASDSSLSISMMTIEPVDQYVDFRNYTYNTSVNLSTGFRYLFGKQNQFIMDFPMTSDNIWTTRLSLIRNGGNCEIVYTASDGSEKRLTRTVTQPTSLPTLFRFNQGGDFHTHYIHIYNHMLSEDELTYLDIIDKQRFGL